LECSTHLAGTAKTQSGPSTAPEGKCFDGIDLLALGNALTTPFYVYSANAIRQRIADLQHQLRGMDAVICFAVKANPTLAILQLMAEAGVGADIVSSGELRRSLRAGIPASKIVFSGVGKSDAELAEALDAGVGRFNVESADELEALQRISQQRGTIAHAAVRINPDVDALTHGKISTGKAENKFGVSIEEARTWFANAGQHGNVRLDGLHMHIGSQILQLEALRQALQRLAAFWRELAEGGHRIESIDVGGGLGVVYRKGHDRGVDLHAYVQAIGEALSGFEGKVVLEPGRYLVAEAGVLLTKVLRTKDNGQRRFLVLDAAMNDLLRPSLYEAWHDIEKISANEDDPDPQVAYDIVGPVCETGDTFAVARLLPPCAPGDLLAIHGAGAYGASMSSTYNSRPLIAEVLVDDGCYALIRRRQSFEDMVAGEQAATAWRAL
jgi:diaminopimelate decarboxylase